MKLLKKTINWLFTHVISKIMVGFYIILVATLFLQVLSRFVLKMPFYWTDELARYMFIGMLFFGAGIGFFKEEHIKLEFLTLKLPLKIQNILGIFVKIAIIIYLMIIMFKGFELVQYVYRQTTPALQIPRSYPYLLIPIGSVIMILGLIYIMIDEN